MVSGHYIVKSNDAHAWVEYYHDKKWQRVDPTEFISPNRILLGGDEFLNPGILNSKNKENNFFFKWYYKAEQRIQAINYKVSLFIDNYDRTGQTNFAKIFNLNYKTFLFIGFILILLLFGFYYLFLTIKLKRRKLHPADKELLKLNKKLKKFNIILNGNVPISLMQEKVKDHPKKEELLEIFNIYQLTKYAMLDKTSQLKEKISQL